MSEYYSAAKAKQILGGITDTDLSRLVKDGKIERIVPPGKKQGIYNKDHVDALANEQKEFYRRIRVIE